MNRLSRIFLSTSSAFKMVKPVKIGTHDGAFHCDEVFACVMLRMLPEFSKGEIVRTRKPELLAECDVVVDVGGVYDHAAKRSPTPLQGLRLKYKYLYFLGTTTTKRPLSRMPPQCRRARSGRRN